MQNQEWQQKQQSLQNQECQQRQLGQEDSQEMQEEIVVVEQKQPFEITYKGDEKDRQLLVESQLIYFEIPNAFHHLARGMLNHIKILTLKDNLIDSIESLAFLDLFNLERIKLINNGVSNLHALSKLHTPILNEIDIAEVKCPRVGISRIRTSSVARFVCFMLEYNANLQFLAKAESSKVVRIFVGVGFGSSKTKDRIIQRMRRKYPGIFIF